MFSGGRERREALSAWEDKKHCDSTSAPRGVRQKRYGEENKAGQSSTAVRLLGAFRRNRSQGRLFSEQTEQDHFLNQ